MRLIETRSVINLFCVLFLVSTKYEKHVNCGKILVSAKQPKLSKECGLNFLGKIFNLVLNGQDSFLKLYSSKSINVDKSFRSIFFSAIT